MFAQVELCDKRFQNFENCSERDRWENSVPMAKSMQADPFNTGSEENSDLMLERAANSYIETMKQPKQIISI